MQYPPHTQLHVLTTDVAADDTSGGRLEYRCSAVFKEQSGVGIGEWGPFELSTCVQSARMATVLATDGGTMGLRPLSAAVPASSSGASYHHSDRGQPWTA